MSQTIIGLDVEDDRTVGKEGGFLAIRRLTLRNRREDGSQSRSYSCDFITRPYGIDAVVVALYHRPGTATGTGAGGAVRVLLRECLRPALAFGRPPEVTPVPEPEQRMFLTELVAGIIEADDRGLDGIRSRAAEEVHEEAGYTVSPDAVVLLGQSTFPSPGTLAEKFWLTAVEIADPAAQATPDGDGSPMEEGSSTRWVALDQAIEMCTSGAIEDAKTELGLRRLRDFLSR